MSFIVFIKFCFETHQKGFLYHVIISQAERQRIVGGGEPILNESSFRYSKEDVFGLQVQRDERKKRSHKKEHGKISFGNLAKNIGQNWKALDPDQRAVFEERAKLEKDHHTKKAQAWKTQQTALRKEAAKKAKQQVQQEESFTSESSASNASNRRRGTAEQGGMMDSQILAGLAAAMPQMSASSSTNAFAGGASMPNPHVQAAFHQQNMLSQQQGAGTQHQHLEPFSGMMNAGSAFFQGQHQQALYGASSSWGGNNNPMLTLLQQQQQDPQTEMSNFHSSHKSNLPSQQIPPASLNPQQHLLNLSNSMQGGITLDGDGTNIHSNLVTTVNEQQQQQQQQQLPATFPGQFGTDSGNWRQLPLDNSNTNNSSSLSALMERFMQQQQQQQMGQHNQDNLSGQQQNPNNFGGNNNNHFGF